MIVTSKKTPKVPKIAAGNLPGGGFRGYIQADEPLELESVSGSLLSIPQDGRSFKISSSEIKHTERSEDEGVPLLKDHQPSEISRELSEKEDSESSIHSGTKSVPFRPSLKRKSIRDTDRFLKHEKSFTDFSQASSYEEIISDEDEEDSLLTEYSAVDIFEQYITPSFKIPEVKEYKKRARGLGRIFTILSPCIANILYSKSNEYRTVKTMIGFPIGLLYGYILHKLVIKRLQLEPFSTQILGIILALWVAVGYAISTQMRCICLLTIPGICGKTGRAYTSTFVITFIITGPIANIMSNAKESVRVMSCTASLNFNHTVERFKLTFKPVKDIVWDFVGAGNKVKDGTKGVKSAYKEIGEEVRDEGEVKMAVAETQQLDEELGQESRVDKVKKQFSRVKDEFGSETESKYGMKSEFRCEGIFTKGVKGCYSSFGAAYDRCHYYLPIIGYLLCWPMKLTFICDIVSTFMGKRACDSKDALSPGFGESMDTADAVQKEFDKEFGVTVQYKLNIPLEKVDQITPQDIGQSVRYQFEKRKHTLDFCLNMMSRILACMFILVFHGASKYCNQYLRTIQFDNKYVTSYFRHIDARRHKQGKMTILPLKKGEKLELTEPFAVRFSAEEKVKLVMNSLRLVGEIVSVSILLAFDWIFYEFLMLIQRHAHVTYYQTGVHHIKMTVFGDGFLGNLVRSILKGFDKKHTINEITTTAECLPRPQKLDLLSIILLYAMFLFIFLLMLSESYALRLRRIICSFFYPKREKKRVLFLYNDRLKKRKSYMKYMRHRVRKMARDQAIAIDSGVLFSLRHLYPKYFDWLGKLGLGKRKCLVCEEIESRKSNFIVCSDECPFCYCPECWRDMKEKCYVCLPDDDEDSPLTEEDYDDTDNDE